MPEPSYGLSTSLGQQGGVRRFGLTGRHPLLASSLTTPDPARTPHSARRRSEWQTTVSEITTRRGRWVQCIATPVSNWSTCMLQLPFSSVAVILADATSRVAYPAKSRSSELSYFRRHCWHMSERPRRMRPNLERRAWSEVKLAESAILVGSSENECIHRRATSSLRPVFPNLDINLANRVNWSRYRIGFGGGEDGQIISVLGCVQRGCALLGIMLTPRQHSLPNRGVSWSGPSRDSASRRQRVRGRRMTARNVGGTKPGHADSS